jgi:hypothetical protein
MAFLANRAFYTVFGVLDPLLAYPLDPQGGRGIPGDYLGITGGCRHPGTEFLKKIQPGPEFFLNFFLKIL